jgi:hypothetical protein
MAPTNQRSLWPRAEQAMVFPRFSAITPLCERVRAKIRIYFVEFSAIWISREPVLSLERSKSAAGKLENRGKLLKVNAGEVAERLKAAVC